MSSSGLKLDRDFLSKVEVSPTVSVVKQIQIHRGESEVQMSILIMEEKEWGHRQKTEPRIRSRDGL